MRNNIPDLTRQLTILEKELFSLKAKYKKALDDGKEFQEVRAILESIRSLERQLLDETARKAWNELGTFRQS